MIEQSFESIINLITFDQLIKKIGPPKIAMDENETAPPRPSANTKTSRIEKRKGLKTYRAKNVAGPSGVNRKAAAGSAKSEKRKKTEAGESRGGDVERRKRKTKDAVDVEAWERKSKNVAGDVETTRKVKIAKRGGGDVTNRETADRGETGQASENVGNDDDDSNDSSMFLNNDGETHNVMVPTFPEVI